MILTIITINYNNAAGLQKTLESVSKQRFKDFEFIVIDGNSTDGSKSLIEDHSVSMNNISFQWISESDTGIYNAMNKGIQLAKGDYLHFLNSGDWLVNERVVENMIDELSNCDILVGNVISVRHDGKVRYNQIMKEVSMLRFYKGTIEHTSAYIRRSLFFRFGFYDEKLKIVSDWKWYLVVVGLNDVNVKFTDFYVTYFDMTGISSTNFKLNNSERRQVLEEFIPKTILADYDRFEFGFEQIERLKRYPWIYAVVWFTERCLFKIDKFKTKHWNWKKVRY